MKWENFSWISAYSEKISHSKRFLVRKDDDISAYKWENLLNHFRRVCGCASIHARGAQGGFSRVRVGVAATHPTTLRRTDGQLRGDFKNHNRSWISTFDEKISHNKRFMMVKNKYKIAFFWEKLPFIFLNRRMGVNPCGREGMFNLMGLHPFCRPTAAGQMSSWQHGFTPILRMVKNDCKSASIWENFPLMIIACGKG